MFLKFYSYSLIPSVVVQKKCDQMQKIKKFLFDGTNCVAHHL